MGLTRANIRTNFWQPKRIVLVVATLLAVAEGPLTVLIDEGSRQARVVSWLTVIVVDLLILGWCYFDSVERGRTLGAWFRVLIVLFGIIALFVYLIKSRGVKRGLFAIVKVLLFCAGMFVIVLASAFLAAVLLGVR